ncbi:MULTISPECIES: DUF805 domain-containing protein [unclassified Sutcliffiella]|uniref:DUF805 domain-containing protein n=1 Tax=unclassified Sutcliffiella TaxID=2837532 RepID=UPI0030D0A251
MHWYLEGFRNYFNFSGRARRKEYWIFTLGNFVIFWVVAILLITIFPNNDTPGVIFILVYGVVMFLPTISITVRRLHDIGRSGWWNLLGLIPLIGWIPIFVFACMESESDNKYGPNPRKLPPVYKEGTIAR